MELEESNVRMSLVGCDLQGLHVIEKIGEGGMGDVWRGHDIGLDIPVAIKVLLPEMAANEDFSRRFMREARAIAKLNHPNIVRVYQAGQRRANGQDLRLMVMELIDGYDAHDLCKAAPDGKLEPKRAAEIILAAARALQYAHDQGVVHRDIKPSNILISKDGRTVKVLDFGLAKLTTQSGAGLDGDTISSISMVFGTPEFMAPEQVEGKPLDARSDIYSLGVTLYELLTGQIPFDGKSPFTIIWGHVREPIPLTEERFGHLSPIFREVLAGMCAKKPAERMPLEKVIAYLEGYLELGPMLEIAGVAPEVAPTALISSTNLVPRESSYIGDAAAMAALAQAFADGHRVVTLKGAAGVGKTRFAQEYALGVLHDYPFGVWFCDLAPARTLDDVARAVAKVLGVPVTYGSPIEQVRTALTVRKKPSLVILDNCEHVAKFVVEALGIWLRDSGSARFIATSRELLRFEGERALVIAPLTQDALSAGVDLFLQRALAAKRSFPAEDPATRQQVQAIVEALDGMPLAIELAAARVTTLAPAKILERLDKRFDLLQSRRRDASPRERSLRGSLDWSWNLLSPSEQSALAQCAVFEGGFFLEAIEEILDLSDFEDVPFAFDVVASLFEKSLLYTVEEAGLAGEIRYFMRHSMRAFAFEKLAMWPETGELVRRRHAKFYLEHFAEMADDQSPEAILWRRLDAGNLASARARG